MVGLSEGGPPSPLALAVPLAIPAPTSAFELALSVCATSASGLGGVLFAVSCIGAVGFGLGLGFGFGGGGGGGAVGSGGMESEDFSCGSDAFDGGVWFCVDIGSVSCVAAGSLVGGSGSFGVVVVVFPERPKRTSSTSNVSPIHGSCTARYGGSVFFLGANATIIAPAANSATWITRDIAMHHGVAVLVVLGLLALPNSGGRGGWWR